MAAKRATRLKPAPVPYPNGGGLKKAMTKVKNPKVVATAKAAVLAKHEAEKAKFEDTYGPQDWNN
jgi:hypothetical protein